MQKVGPQKVGRTFWLRFASRLCPIFGHPSSLYSDLEVASKTISFKNMRLRCVGVGTPVAFTLARECELEELFYVEKENFDGRYSR
jgi:hypothetical protein